MPRSAISALHRIRRGILWDVVKSVSFNACDVILQGCVQFRTILAMMDAAMAVWTKRSHEPRIIRATIAQAPNMMGLKVLFALMIPKRCRFSTQLALSSGPLQDIAAHD